ncbi:hypothetical protein GCQ56_00835 [Marinifilum sp. N1E240]|uniref:hypothetical protein n=1 Tax=Marinifilum sp. N1E240 TaxID=2608082 RepID=UPI00128D9765|nr:hypothetical protein [Marinifilum sp. N1E240]MPQ45537.1 hypothetical protein [Marinifilum sp. N1E240]
MEGFLVYSGWMFTLISTIVAVIQFVKKKEAKEEVQVLRVENLNLKKEVNVLHNNIERLEIKADNGSVAAQNISGDINIKN